MSNAHNKSLSRLTSSTLKAALAGRLPAGRRHDGGGLYLNIRPDGGASWLFRYMREKVPQTMGLGALGDISAPAARAAAQSLRTQLAAGLDPRAERANRRVAEAGATKAARGKATTFRDAAEIVLTEMAGSAFTANTKHAWRASIEQHAYPVIGDRPLDDIDNAAILKVLKPIWGRKPVTGRNVRQRIERVFAVAKSRGLCAHNPALLIDLKAALSLYPPEKTATKHAALPWQDAPTFYRRLLANDGYAPRALRLVMLAGLRTYEVTGARFEEFDLKTGIWTIPAGRMKGKPGARYAHTVPITPDIARFIEEMEFIRRGPFLFPHRDRPTESLSESALQRLLSKLGIRGKATVHGFRSTFRDWARDHGRNREAAEAALAHRVKGVEGHYARSDMIEFRRGELAAWNAYLTSQPVPGRGHLRLVEAA